jgi:superfamily II DNA or RNA helicase
MITPYPDQIDFTNKIIGKVADGYTRICCQASTGFGKTISLGYIVQRYLNRKPSARICVIVHRTELEEQTVKTLYNFGIKNVQVVMARTFYNRLQKHGHIHFDMMIVDECHRGEFFDIIDLYKASELNTLVLGFTATPLSANKKRPLKSFFQTIVVATEINQLIKMGRLCPAIHISVEQDINKISKSAGDYNMKQMGVEFSKPKLIEGVVDAYKQHADGKKALIFNTTVEHSIKVTDAFIAGGYTECRNLDSKSTTDKIRKETFEWFRGTPGAILNNIGIATTGTDVPSIEAILHNYKTTSLTKWLQVGGRGGRTYPGKDYFLNIDMGDNIDGEGFGHWNERHDWEQYFLHPDKKGEGVAPMKKCPKCDARIYMSSTLCMWCGHEMPRVTVYTDMLVSLRICPEKGIKRNSHDSLMKSVQISADRIKAQRITYNEKRELMFYAFKELYERSSFEPKTHILSHLVSVYGK